MTQAQINEVKTALHSINLSLTAIVGRLGSVEGNASAITDLRSEIGELKGKLDEILTHIKTPSEETPVPGNPPGEPAQVKGDQID